MFSCLAAFFEAGFVFAFSGGDDEDAYVGLGGSTDHVWHVCFVSWGIEDTVSPFLGLEEPSANFDGLSLRSFFFRQIQSPRQIPRLSASILGFSLVFVHCPLVYHARRV